MRFHQMFGDGKSQSKPSASLSAGVVCLTELLKHMWQEVR